MEWLLVELAMSCLPQQATGTSANLRVLLLLTEHVNYNNSLGAKGLA